MNIAAFIAACRKLYIPEEEAFRQLVETVDYSGLYTDLEGYLYDAVTVACECTHTRTHTHTRHTHTHTQLCSAGDIKELKDPLCVITCLQRVLETAQ